MRSALLNKQLAICVKISHRARRSEFDVDTKCNCDQYSNNCTKVNRTSS